MTDSEIDAAAEGMLLHLKTYEPAQAMLILATLNVKAILSATPKHIGALDASLKLLFEQVVAGCQSAIRTEGGFTQ